MLWKMPSRKCVKQERDQSIMTYRRGGSRGFARRLCGVRSGSLGLPTECVIPRILSSLRLVYRAVTLHEELVCPWLVPIILRSFKSWETLGKIKHGN